MIAFFLFFRAVRALGPIYELAYSPRRSDNLGQINNFLASDIRMGIRQYARLRNR